MVQNILVTCMPDTRPPTHGRDEKQRSRCYCGQLQGNASGRRLCLVRVRLHGDREPHFSVQWGAVKDQVHVSKNATTPGPAIGRRVQHKTSVPKQGWQRTWRANTKAQSATSVPDGRYNADICKPSRAPRDDNNARTHAAPPEVSPHGLARLHFAPVERCDLTEHDQQVEARVVAHGQP